MIGITNYAGVSILGKTTSTSLANLNPLRYRGYYYDNETGFYYLQSRYYDPVNRRFINADSYASTGQGFIGANMYAYCRNNPIGNADYNGHMGEAVVGIIGEIYLWLMEFSSACPPAAILLLGATILYILAEASVSFEEKREEITNAALAYVDSMNIPRDKCYNNSVYVLRDSENFVRYVGRTNNPYRRMKEHQRDPKKANYKMTVVMTGLSKKEAMVAEQTLISVYTLGYLDNARREISKGNVSKFSSYASAVCEILEGVTEERLLAFMGRD